MSSSKVKFQEKGFRNPLYKIIGITFGPAIVLLAFGQATGELIHWPYLVSSYETFFLYAIIPACVIQFPIFSFLAKQTMLTGESFFGALSKRSWLLSSLFWLIFFLTSIWIASYTTAGGVAFVELADQIGFSITNKGIVSNYVAWVINFIFFILLLRRGKPYSLVTFFTSLISIASIVLITIVLIYTLVSQGIQLEFVRGLFAPPSKIFPDNWNTTDANAVLTGIIFAGLGGLWNVLYSSWMRNENLGIARVDADDQNSNSSEYLEYHREEPSLSLIENLKSKYNYAIGIVHKDLAIALSANALMLIALAYITYVFYPTGAEAPQDLEIITTLADATRSVTPWLGGIFYILIGIFLVDTWLTAGDSLSKIHSNFILGVFDQFGLIDKGNHEFAAKIGYTAFLVFLYSMTIISTLVAPPQALIFFNGVMSGLGSVLLIIGIGIIEVSLRSKFDEYPTNIYLDIFLIMSFLFYAFLAVVYFYI